ncbi:STAS domain-containing protein [Kibdelosporangium phytohabitans]|uniref:STAS domain-containing protein n=1 Tax=Kibdelosporangium phytohabitans TaxID=860235 RepID=UPI0014702964|nr:STAS domain-containing protein [Kibdelosporangium phytohabitans]MBE1467397.1 anti-sigma B factor antagonist [Kibdelosporangium phytohabitans]
MVDHVLAARVVSVGGEIDLNTAGQLDKVVVAAINETTVGVVVLDLTGVTFLSSNGISALLQGKAHGASVGVELRVVVATGGAARRSLEITGLTDLLANYSTLSAALAS